MITVAVVAVLVVLTVAGLLLTRRLIGSPATAGEHRTRPVAVAQDGRGPAQQELSSMAAWLRDIHPDALLPPALILTAPAPVTEDQVEAVAAALAALAPPPPAHSPDWAGRDGLPAYAAEIVGHDGDTAAAVDSMWTRAMGQDVARQIRDGEL